MQRAPERLVCVALATLAMAAALAVSRFANTWLATGLAAALGLALALRVDATALLRLLRPTPRSLLAGLFTGAAMIALTFVVWPPLADAVPALEAALRSAYRPLADWPGARAALPVIALVVLAEEVVWRGVLLEHLEPRVSGWRRVALAASVYACTQLATGSALLIGVALACGAVWTLLRLYTASVIAPLVAHLAWSLAVFVVRPLV